MNIFVGNLSFETTQGELKQLFETIGEVASVVIVMEKEKKAPKSRGFGFVEMPDESQALAAIVALNGKDFMGRLLNVNPTRPKTDTQRQSEIKKREVFKARLKIKAEAKERFPKAREEKAAYPREFTSKPGTYKGGRRTRSYMMRTGVVEMDKGTKPWQKRQENPMRWRSRQDQPKPWQRGTSARKPWEKPEGASEEVRPWKKVSIEDKPWKKPVGSSKPWQRGKSERKPWEKPESGTESKPWAKRGGRPQVNKFKGRGKPVKILVDKRK